MRPHKSELCLNTPKNPKKFSDFTPNPAFFPLKTCPLCASQFYTVHLKYLLLKYRIIHTKEHIKILKNMHKTVI